MRNESFKTLVIIKGEAFKLILTDYAVFAQ